jgi:hypothetical protein
MDSSSVRNLDLGSGRRLCSTVCDTKCPQPPSSGHRERRTWDARGRPGRRCCPSASPPLPVSETGIGRGSLAAIAPSPISAGGGAAAGAISCPTARLEIVWPGWWKNSV